MIRKCIVVGGGLFLVSLFFFGADALSYVQTSSGCLKDSVHNSIPIDFQIKRARRMIRHLVPEVRKNMHIIAKEEVEVERLEEQIAKVEARTQKEKKEILRLQSDLSANKKAFKYGNRKYTVEQVKTDLANRFERFKTNEATLGSLREICKARQKSLEAAQHKLSGMLSAKRQLSVDVENLEARLQMVAAAETTSNYSFDDSRLGRAKELVSELKTRLDVAERLVSAEGYYQGEIDLDQATPDNIVEQVAEYFQKERPDQIEN